jgi:uncharacterized repeat protein (TIGR01451 family)
MSRFSILLIVPLIIAAILFSTDQLKASSLDPAGTPVPWPSSGLIGLAQSTAPDLSISKSASANPVVGADLTYNIVVANKSGAPNDAQNVRVIDNLPLDVSFKSVTPSQGSCSGTTLISCDLQTITISSSATVTLVVVPTKVGIITNIATVTATNWLTPTSDGVATLVSGRVYLPIINK